MRQSCSVSPAVLDMCEGKTVFEWRVHRGLDAFISLPFIVQSLKLQDMCTTYVPVPDFRFFFFKD